MRKILSVILAIVMLFGMSVVATEKNLEVNPGRYDVRIFGAVPNDGKDDTEAFTNALAKSMFLKVNSY